MSQVEVGVEEAQNVLGSLITAAARDGEVTVISKGGIPAAALVPFELLRQLSPTTCLSCGKAILAHSQASRGFRAESRGGVHVWPRSPRSALPWMTTAEWPAAAQIGRISRAGTNPLVTERDRDSRHRAVRDAATAQVATADQDSVRAVEVTAVLIKRCRTALTERRRYITGLRGH
jgi:prevent-host-death family protein